MFSELGMSMVDFLIGFICGVVALAAFALWYDRHGGD